MVRTQVSPKAFQQGKRIQIQLYTPHPAQQLLHKCKKRFRVISCGRRFGKSLMACNELTKFAVENNRVNCVWISPVYRQCKVIYRLLKLALDPIIIHHSDSELRLVLANNSTIEFYSATNADAIRGNGFHSVIMDEVADIDPDVWFSVVRPTLSTTNGWVIFIGTPKGQNWFFDLFRKADDPYETEYASFTFPTSANPYVPKAEIEAAKRDLPEDVFRQEYTAEFLALSAGVFRGIERCIEGELTEAVEGKFYVSVSPQPEYTYVAGWDVAKWKDFSALSVINTSTMHVDAFFRTNQVDYTQQIEQVVFISQMYNDAAILQDATGVGDAVLEMLRSKGVAAEGYVYGNLSKKILIEELQVSIEHRHITFPKIDVMIGELRSFQYKITPSRLISYEAPKGYNDDCVNSLALANHAAMSGGVALVPEGNDEIYILDENNEKLLDRQLNVADLLGGVELVASYGGDLW